ncbi:LA-RELATED PROTEIN 6C [Salix purpurea]|uniref:LA-RELATED PROTEIN 6C n=1 Tax=Salix purpurea TaxID=77065 RepID=A0A9Q0WFE4_SALPP|nr:LA-RELATED PROTEIN 6C [Salix purpurea]
MKETTEPKHDSSRNCDSVTFKFNAQAPEFVPRSHTNTAQLPISGYFYPCFQNFGATASATGGSDWIFVGDEDHAAYLISDYPNHAMSNWPSKNRDVLTDVPIAVIASTKKTRSLINDNDLLVQALKSSSKLVTSCLIFVFAIIRSKTVKSIQRDLSRRCFIDVLYVLTEDDNKVKRKIPFTDKHREELQVHGYCVLTIAIVNSAKTIRICHPQESNSSRSKNDFFVTNKLHALVELETRVVAEKAVEKLNDERNWTKGLRVRLLLRFDPKSVLTRGRMSEFDNILEEEDSSLDESMEDTSQPNNSESAIESFVEDNPGASKKARARGRGKGKGRSQIICARGMLAPPKCGCTPQCESFAKQTSKGPRMPDGSKGFTVGRGKPPLVTQV